MPRIETYTADGRLKTDTGAADLAGHTGDATDAHDASAVSVADAGGFYTGDDVEDVLQELGTATSPSVIGGGAFRNSIIEGRQVWKYSDFLVLFSTTDQASDLTILNSGTGAAITETYPTAGVPIANHPGIIQLSTGTTSTGRSTLSGPGLASTTIPGILFGSGETRVGWLMRSGPTLSDGTHRYHIRAGFNNVLTHAEGTNALFFRYTDNVNSGKWEIVSRVNNVESAADSGVTFAVDTWYWLEIEVNAAGTSAEFFINKVSVGTRTPPSGGTNGPVSPAFGIYKSIGSSGARTVFLDAYYFAQGVTR